MKRLLGLLFLVLLGPPAFGAGLIIVGDDKFWEGSPVLIHPTPPIHHRRIILPPRPVRSPGPM
jgi:hypothetical protein